MNREYETQWDGIVYIHNDQHRDGKGTKSQWTISKSEELCCFEHAARLLFIEKLGLENTSEGWGLYLIDEQVEYLGNSSTEGSKSLRFFIAKFVDGNENGKWHGYPAGPGGRSQDIPPGDVLLYWVGMNYLRPGAMRKIVKNQYTKP
ncbi:hypothetical protein [Herpetosiphon gulosus]|uniref:hypothetical protein n=1 Tax=Herpetosiphon gulosus TaxID=1973496 RepID=UPI0031EB002D